MFPVRNIANTLFPGSLDGLISFLNTYTKYRTEFEEGQIFNFVFANHPSFTDTFVKEIITIIQEIDERLQKNPTSLVNHDMIILKYKTKIKHNIAIYQCQELNQSLNDLFTILFAEFKIDIETHVWNIFLENYIAYIQSKGVSTKFAFDDEMKKLKTTLFCVDMKKWKLTVDLFDDLEKFLTLHPDSLLANDRISQEIWIHQDRITSKFEKKLPTSLNTVINLFTQIKHLGVESFLEVFQIYQKSRTQQNISNFSVPEQSKGFGGNLEQERMKLIKEIAKLQPEYFRNSNNFQAMLTYKNKFDRILPIDENIELQDSITKLFTQFEFEFKINMAWDVFITKYTENLQAEVTQDYSFATEIKTLEFDNQPTSGKLITFIKEIQNIIQSAPTYWYVASNVRMIKLYMEAIEKLQISVDVLSRTILTLNARVNHLTIFIQKYTDFKSHRNAEIFDFKNETAGLHFATDAVNIIEQIDKIISKNMLYQYPYPELDTVQLFMEELMKKLNMYENDELNKVMIQLRNKILQTN
jgi:hypothetical protein